MSVSPTQGDHPAELVAGFLASAAIFASLIAVVYRPFRIAPVALLIALIAAGMGGRHKGLAAFAVVVGSICFALGMTIAILTGNPLY